MITEHQKYPLLHKDLVTASLALSFLAQQLKHKPATVTDASVINAISEQTAKLDSVLWRQNYENEEVVNRHKIQLAFTRHPIRSVTDLSHAPLNAKRETLNAMAIVPVTVAASYLGVAKGTIYQLPYQAGIPPWEKHLGVQAMSINQLILLGKNPDFYERRHVEIAPQACAETTLDHSIMLNEETANAFLDASRSELLALTHRRYFYRARFRLAELEQIRIAKLNQAAVSRKLKLLSVPSNFFTLEAM